jgi:hypothetical protein
VRRYRRPEFRRTSRDFRCGYAQSLDLPSRKRQFEAQTIYLDAPGLITNRPQVLKNTLFEARPDGTYSEIAKIADISASEWSWQPAFIDIDLNGHPDLLITSGYAHDVQDRDAELQVKARQKNYQAITNAEERRRVFQADLLTNNQLYPKLNTPIVAFKNNGDMTFTDVTDLWGTGQSGVHNGIAFADFDGDGDLDFVVNNLNAPAALYRNNSSAPIVSLRVKGNAPNTQAIGAHISLFDGAVPVQTQEIFLVVVTFQGLILSLHLLPEAAVKPCASKSPGAMASEPLFRKFDPIDYMSLRKSPQRKSLFKKRLNIHLSPSSRMSPKDWATPTAKMSSTIFPDSRFSPGS